MANIILSGIKTRLVQRNFLDSTYTDQIFLDDCHYGAQDIWSAIIYARKGNKNWDVWTLDTVALFLDGYAITPAVTSTSVGADFVETVEIAYNSDTYANTTQRVYKPCRQATTEEIKDWTRLLEQQDPEHPIYYYYDDKLYIAPEVRTGEAGVDRIRVTGVRSIASGSWTTSTTETDIKLPVFMFDALFYYLMWKSSEHMRRDDNVVMSKYNFYIQELNRQVRKMNNEVSETMETRTYIDPIIHE